MVAPNARDSPAQQSRDLLRVLFFYVAPIEVPFKGHRTVADPSISGSLSAMSSTRLHRLAYVPSASLAITSIRSCKRSWLGTTSSDRERSKDKKKMSRCGSINLPQVVVIVCSAEPEDNLKPLNPIDAYFQKVAYTSRQLIAAIEWAMQLHWLL
jgi:hypothetical protein